MTAWIVGFDLSLAAPAACALPSDWKPGDWKRVRSFLFKPSAPKNDDQIGQLRRYELISKWACNVIAEHLSGMKRPICFVENYGFSKNTQHGSRVMESGGITRMDIFRRFAIVLNPVAQNSARKLFLGKLPSAKKGQKLKVPIKVTVQDVLFNKCKAPKKWGGDEADAWVIANYGLAEAGGKCLTLAR